MCRCVKNSRIEVHLCAECSLSSQVLGERNDVLYWCGPSPPGSHCYTIISMNEVVSIFCNRTFQGVELTSESNFWFWFMCNELIQASFSLFCVSLDHQIAINQLDHKI